MRVDDNVMEIETDKTTVGVPTPVSGVIEEIYVQDGDTVKAGQDLFKIKPGEVSAKPAAAAPEAPKPAAAAPPPPPVQALKPAATSASAPPPPPPPRVSSLPMTFMNAIEADRKSGKWKIKLNVRCIFSQHQLHKPVVQYRRCQSLPFDMPKQLRQQ